MRFCACVVTYYPDEQLLRENVACYQPFAERVYVWQNTPIAERGRYLWNDLGDNVVWIGEDTNVGISHALNAVLRRCQEEGCDYLLTMDQDSRFEDFSHFLGSVERQLPSREVISFGPETPGVSAPKGEWKEMDYIITSGAMVDVKKALSIGGYREEFLVDGIDLDFCFKAKKAGFKVMMLGGVLLNQQFGETIQVGEKRIVSYSPQRLYNIVLSQWMMWAEYPQYFKKGHFLKIFYLGEPYHIVCFQKNKLSKLLAIAKATCKGIAYRFRFTN